jgi:hypothetical protein
LAIHCAGFSNPAEHGRDHINWPSIAKALREIGYDGDVVIESFTRDVLATSDGELDAARIADGGAGPCYTPYPHAFGLQASGGRMKKIMSAINIFLALFKKYEHTHIYE